MNKLLNNDFTLSIIKKTSNIVFGFLTLILLNRYLGVTLKGEYTYIINYTVIISVILEVGISNVYGIFKRKKIENCFEIFISLTIIQFIIYLVLALIIMAIGKFQNYMVNWICIISLTTILTSQLRYINLVEHYKYSSISVIIMAVVNFISMFIVYIICKQSLTYAFIVLIIKDLVITALLIKKINIKKLFKKEYIKFYGEIIKNGILPMLSSLLIMLNYKTDIIMLNYMNVSYYEIGLYSTGLALAEYIWLIPEIFKDVIQKRSAIRNDIESINFSTRISTTIIIIIFIGILLFGKPAIGILFGRDYIDAFEVTIILFIGVYSMIYYKIIGTLFIADSKSKQYFLILLAGSIINIIVNLGLIPKLRIIGAATASVISYSLIGILFLMLYKKYYNVKIKDVLFIKKHDIEKIKSFIKK